METFLLLHNIKIKLIVNWTKSKTFRSNQFCWVSVARCTLFLHQDRAILLLCLTAEREFPHSSLGCVRLLSFQRINENSPSFVTSEQRHKLEEIKFQQWSTKTYLLSMWFQAVLLVTRTIAGKAILEFEMFRKYTN